MSKSELTLNCERTFKSAYTSAIASKEMLRENGWYPGCHQEVRLRTEGQTDKIIDFVVGIFPTDEQVSVFDAENHVSLNTATGCELKTSHYDLHRKTGKNFYAYHFNYLIVTRELFYDASQLVKNIPHLGLLLVDSELCRVKLVKRATFLEDNELTNAQVRGFTEEQCTDSLELAFYDDALYEATSDKSILDVSLLREFEHEEEDI